MGRKDFVCGRLGAKIPSKNVASLKSDEDLTERRDGGESHRSDGGRMRKTETRMARTSEILDNMSMNVARLKSTWFDVRRSSLWCLDFR
jgi:hypothetical protein